MIVGYHSNAFPRTVASTLLDAVQMYWVRAVKMFRKMLLMLKCFTPVQMCSIKIAIKTCSWKWKCYVKMFAFFGRVFILPTRFIQKCAVKMFRYCSTFCRQNAGNVLQVLKMLWKCFAPLQVCLIQCFCIFRMRFIKTAIKKFVVDIIGMARNAGFCWKVCILSTCIQSTTCPEHVSVWLLAWNF